MKWEGAGDRGRHSDCILIEGDGVITSYVAGPIPFGVATAIED